MLKGLLYLVLIIVLVGAAAGAYHLFQVAERNKQALKPYQGPRQVYQSDLGKVLVIYYSLTGHTRAIADQIAALTQADTYEIKTAQPLDLGWFYLNVKKQLKTKQYPQLVQNTPDLSQYDVIFVGSPVWWYTVSTPVLSFLQQTDFMGKKVVPFSTQGSNFGRFFDVFQQEARHAVLQQGESFNNVNASYDDAVHNKIVDWLRRMK